MTLSDLLFLASLLFVLVCLLAIFLAAFLLRWRAVRRWGKLLAAFLAVYVPVLLVSGLLMPRRIYPPGALRCWDDWCATAVRVAPATPSTPLPCVGAPGTRIWVAEIEVSSVAKRVRQRAPDAYAELEDEQGTRYQTCAAPLAQGGTPARTLADPLDPGDSFSVLLPFRLPTKAQPAGVVLYHGDFPGIVIIGNDSSVLHRPALQRIVVGE